jgi:PAS domain S-box-containing protein
MTKPLRVLHLEDNRDYSALVASKLAADGLKVEITCVDTKADFQAAIAKGGFDLVIADYSLPDYNGILALKLAHEKLPDVPIMLVSGTIGEEAAIESLKAGATDYVLKHWPERLVPSVRRVLREAEEHKSRLQAEAALKGSEFRFQSVWEGSVDAMRLTDENGIIMAANQAYCELAGMKHEELVGRSFTVTYPEGVDLQKKLCDYQQAFQARATSRGVEKKLVFRKGRVAEIEVTHSFVESAAQRPLLLALFRNVSERKRLEDQLRHSQKMEAIGQLAGGVAHDFNNILTVIQGHASLIRSGQGLPASMKVSVEQIYKAADRAAALTRQLLTFSRRQMMQPTELDLNSVVSNLTRMLGRILGEDVSLQCNYSTVPPFIHADLGMMEQVVMNLAVNSRDAMATGGRLAIGISMHDLGDQEAQAHPEGRAGSFACLTVTDTGSGIPPEVLPHIFEPFFTTKAVGKGTGLGLATVYGIVKQHKGWIELESMVGEGTTFRVYLPAIKDMGPKREETASREAPRQGSETILVVEDEEPVRVLVSGILSGSGYRVLNAATGPEALEVWRHHKQDIALLLTDIVMPEGMTGRDLAEKLQAEKPGLKAIFTSGYSSDIVGKDFILQEGVNFLQKPYPPQNLTQAVRKCLDGK